MPLYTYQELDSGEEHDVEQRISAPAFTHRTDDPEPRWLHMPEHAGTRVRIPDEHGGYESAYPVRRVIAGGAQFSLAAGGVGWASGGYAKTAPQIIREQTWRRA